MRALPISFLAFALALTAAAQPPAPAAPAPDAAAAARRAAQSQLPPPPVPPPALTGPETFTCGAAKPGEISLVPAAMVFDPVAGFDLQTVPTIANGICSSDKPLFFSIAVPEGNYRITLNLGGKAASVTTVRGEERRLFVENLAIAAGKTATRTFDINVRIPDFRNPDGTRNRVRLKGDEIDRNFDWDQKLTLEFNGTNPAFHSLTIEPISEPVIYLVGDSTMVDQHLEPWTSWGQMFTRFLLPGVVIANQAESGESAASFVGEQRWAKVLSLIKPGDWFIVQFAHNDQKAANGMPHYIEIMTDFVNQVRAKGATPVIVTSMNRETFDADGHITDSFAGYIQAARKVAADTNTALIDLNAMSKTMYETWGPAGADHAFMKFKAGSYPGVERDISDTTHFNSYGAYELARCIVKGIKDDNLPIAKFLDPSVPAFDPAHPDAFADFHSPYSPPPKADVTPIPQTTLR